MDKAKVVSPQVASYLQPQNSSLNASQLTKNKLFIHIFVTVAVLVINVKKFDFVMRYYNYDYTQLFSPSQIII